MSRFRPALLALSLLLGTPMPGLAEPLGRLFFTPQQRNAIDRQQQMQADLQPDPAKPAQPLTFNGEIRHGNGQLTRWINGEVSRHRHSSAPPLPVGDTLHPASGEQASLLGTGQLRIHRPGER
jgi:hypothetical protein